jgi:hypothetical protein
MPCTWHVCGRRAIYTGFWWGKLEGKDYFEDLSTDGKIILKWILKR